METALTRRGLVGGMASAETVAGPLGLPRFGARRAGAQATPTGGATADTGSGPFTLASLAYRCDALELMIDALTMQLHYDRHHAAYGKNLDAAVTGLPDLQNLSPEALIGDLSAVPEAQRTLVRNNGGGHVNHTVCWEIMGPDGGGEPTEAFGDAATMREEVEASGGARFGSGWAWVVLGTDGVLVVTSAPNQDSPLMGDLVDVPGTPILAVDVREHFYYLTYQNHRLAYLAAGETSSSGTPSTSATSGHAAGRRRRASRDSCGVARTEQGGVQSSRQAGPGRAASVSPATWCFRDGTTLRGRCTAG